MALKFEMFRIATVAVLFAAAVATRPLSACAFPAEFQVDDVKFADAVVSGRIRNYEIVENYAVITIVVDRSMSGQKYITDSLFRYSEEAKVSWQNSTFELPEGMPQDLRIFALRRVGSAGPPLRAASGVIYPDPRGLEFTILQAPCSSPFILPHSTMGWDNIQKILDGGSPPNFIYHDPDFGYMVRVWELEMYLKAIAALTLLLVFTNALTLWKYRKIQRQARSEGD